MSSPPMSLSNLSPGQSHDTPPIRRGPSQSFCLDSSLACRSGLISIATFAENPFHTPIVLERPLATPPGGCLVN
eukprot:14098812-Heterocapsa_arctica.AAC.1